ncbi:DUF2577 family protein [Sporosarcina cyprini]|uniref:DUF2577 family protein n=1 Tax=Sporosarcina cyprini TaxID=2910523 RepID=UPI001EDCD58D|nr:DUF2577 family protein [Sporosarcina cyprini]MCG3089126.1 DUF2577 domain-containing protein [Sporosarcina cyprini]
MADKDGLTEFAKLFKDRDPKDVPSITTGIVESLPPEPVIRLSEKIAPDKSQLIFASNLIAGYERHIKFTDSNCGTTTTNSNHNHDIATLNIDTLMQWTDTLKIGDEVIVVPVADGQMYYVIDKAVKFE